MCVDYSFIKPELQYWLFSEEFNGKVPAIVCGLFNNVVTLIALLSDII